MPYIFLICMKNLIFLIYTITKMRWITLCYEVLSINRSKKSYKIYP